MGFNPELYKEIYGSGVTAERDRVGSWAVYFDVDPKAVQEGIAKGEALSVTKQAEFTRKVAESSFNKTIKGEDDDVETEKPEEKTPEDEKKEKEEKDFDNEVSSELKKEA